MILLLDNFDSFTCNLADYLSQTGVPCVIKRNDSSLQEIIKEEYSAVVLSPGPGTPKSSGIMMEVIDYYHEKIPILGICLGHQAIGMFWGCEIKKAIIPKHGKISTILTEIDPIFKNIPKKFNVVRYHSLIIDKIPAKIKVIARTEQGEVMAIKHRSLPIYGLQYHPEAALTEYGKEVLKNWIFLNNLAD